MTILAIVEAALAIGGDVGTGHLVNAALFLLGARAHG